IFRSTCMGGEDVDDEFGIPIDGVDTFLGLDNSERLKLWAHNDAVRGAARRGLVGKGTFRDRFFEVESAAALLRRAEVVVRRGDDGVAVPGTSARVRIGKDVGSWECAGRSGLLYAVE